jgi:hypothetical protein
VLVLVLVVLVVGVEGGGGDRNRTSRIQTINSLYVSHFPQKMADMVACLLA